MNEQVWKICFKELIQLATQMNTPYYQQIRNTVMKVLRSRVNTPCRCSIVNPKKVHDVTLAMTNEETHAQACEFGLFSALLEYLGKHCVNTRMFA